MKKIFLWITLLTWTALIWRLTTTDQIVVAHDTWLQNILMMGAHFTFFGIQAVLVYLAVSSKNVAITTTSIYGALIEFRQLYVLGRSADPMDWALDTLGAIAFLFVFKKLQSKS